MPPIMDSSAIGLSASALDDSGKAVFGVPGPGTYSAWGSIGQQVEARKSSAARFSFGVRGKKEPFISHEHSKADVARDSPGPAYNPSFKSTRTTSARAAFSGADRNAARLQYIAAAFTTDNLGQTTPGPGTYRLRYGKGIAKTFGDAPMIKFGSGPGPGMVTGASPRRDAPGPGAHDMDRGLGSVKETGYTARAAPAYSFSGGGSPEAGRSRDRTADVKSMYISDLHRKVEPHLTIGVENMPSSNSYVLESPFGKPNQRHSIDAVTVIKKEPAYSFGTASRDQASKVFLSKQHVLPSMSESPGPVYSVGDLFPHKPAAATFNFGRATRFYSPELGGNHAGPVVGPLFENYGSNSPGPAAYRVLSGKGIPRSMGDGPTHVIGTSKRASVEGRDAAWVPGPGTYFPKKVAESSGGRGPFSNPPSFSVASCIRSDVASAAADATPGPGAYDTSTGLSQKDVRKSAAPSFRFGKDADRASFLARNVASNPGPGEYDRIVDRRGNANIDRPVSPTSGPRSPKKGYSFGMALKKHGPEEARGSTVREHISSLHTEEHKGTAGAGLYDVRPISFNNSHAIGDAPKFRFGTGKRANAHQFISQLHSATEGTGSGDDMNGPGSYSTDAAIRGIHSKFNEGYNVKFGKATRSQPYTVLF